MVLAAILACAFSTQGRDEVLLAGMIVVIVFLAIEARRYHDCDVFRARARLLQENLFANALNPAQGVEHQDWREELSEDYRDPKLKMPYLVALRRRLRRVYLPLLLLLLNGWIFKITAATPPTWSSGPATTTPSRRGRWAPASPRACLPSRNVK